MTEELSLTPLSGEIMTGRPRQDAARQSRSGEIENAVFETLRADPPAVHAAPETLARPSGMDLFDKNARTPTARPNASPAGIGFWAAGAAAALAAFWFAGGHALAVRAAADLTAQPVRLASLTSRVVGEGTHPTLLVDGTLDNTAPAPAALPLLTVNVTDGEGRLTSYRLGHIDGYIAAHGSWRFSSRLGAPRSGVTAVTVTVDGRTAL